MDAERSEMMIAGVFLFRVLIKQVLLNPEKSLGLKKVKLDKIVNVASFFYNIFIEYLRLTLPVNSKN